MKNSMIYFLCLVSSTTFSQKIEKQFIGDYHASSSSVLKYGVIVIGGAEGGKPTELAEIFVDEQYSVLSLAYFNDGGLPSELENIPLEYSHAAIKWLSNQSKVKENGVVLVGWSKGAELALLLASKNKHVKGVIAISPSSVVWPGILKDWKKTPGSSWTLKNKPLPCVPFDSGDDVNSLISLYTNSLKNERAVSAATIHIEKSKAQILLLSGSQDAVWPATLMSEQIIKRLEDSNYKRKFTHINYPELGHLLDEKYISKNVLHPSRIAILSFLNEFNNVQK